MLAQVMKRLLEEGYPRVVSDRSLFLKHWGRERYTLSRGWKSRVLDAGESKRAAAGRNRAAALRALMILPSLLMNYSTLTEICFGLASSFFGRVKRSMPSLNCALMASAFTLGGSVNER